MEKRDSKGFIILEENVPGALKCRAEWLKINTPSINAKKRDTIFFTEEDYDPRTIKFNLGKTIEMVRPKGDKKKKFSWKDLIPKVLGATFEIGADGLDFKVFYD